MDKYKKKKDSYNLVFAIIWGLLFVYWFTTAIYNVRHEVLHNDFK